MNVLDNFEIQDIFIAILGLFAFVILLFIKGVGKRDAVMEKRVLKYHIEKDFFQALKRSAIEHGYKGLFPSTRYLYVRFMQFLYQYLSLIVPFSGFKVWLQRRRGVKIGVRVHISTDVLLDEVFPEYIIIEDDVSLAGRNHILTHTKPMDYHSNLFESKVEPVIIKKNAWISIGVTILPGVTIGEGSVIAAGSVVNRDIPANVLAGGVPAKIIRKFNMSEGRPISFTK